MNTTEFIYQLIQTGHPVSTDTRKDLTNSIFFAIKGENFDGNNYIHQALEKGAKLVISDSPQISEGNNILKVENTISTLQQVAALHRKQLKIPIIAINGSNGKTTTKELVSSVLSTKYKVFSTLGNMNNHIGLPLSLLSITHEHQVGVIEIGANHIGENELLTNITSPTHGIITNIGKDHLGEFGGFENVVKAYKEYIDYFVSNNEFPFIYPASDPHIAGIITACHAFSFGESNAMQTGKVLESKPEIVVEIDDRNFGKSIISTKMFGSYNLNNILAAKIIADIFEINQDSFRNAIEQYLPQNMRSQILNWKGNQVFLDTYNANPSSMQLALNEFNNLKINNKILIIGDMHELGEYSFSEHAQIIETIKGMKLMQVVLVGNEFEKFKNNLNCIHFINVSELKTWFDLQTYSDCSFLVKASRSEKLELLFKA